MNYLTWILILLMLAWFFEGYLADRNNPHLLTLQEHSQQGEPILRLKRDRSGHYRSPGELNGVPVIFIIDTGATDLSIPEAVAEQAGLKKGIPRRYQTANGLITAYHTKVSNVSLGHIHLLDINASINPEMDGRQVLLGMSVLRHLEFSQRENILTIKAL